MLNFNLFDFYAICSLRTTKVLSLIKIATCRATTVGPRIGSCTDTIINLKLEIISGWPSSNIRDIKSDEKLIVFSCDSCIIFGKIISIHIFSCKTHCTASECICCWGCEAIKRQRAWRLKISEENGPLVFGNTEIVRVCKVFILEDWISTNIAASLCGIKTRHGRSNTVRMAEEIALGSHHNHKTGDYDKNE